jgi:hypothetical protein
MIEKVRSDWNPNVPLGNEDHSGGVAVALIELYETHQA